MSQNLTEFQNSSMGLIAGSVEIVCLQPTNYLKACSQQRLPPVFQPKVLYRGLAANILNMGGCTLMQFGMCGFLAKQIAGESKRQIQGLESIAVGFGGGVFRYDLQMLSYIISKITLRDIYFSFP